VSWDYPSTNSHAVAHGLLHRGITPLWENASPLVVVSGNTYYDKVDTGTVYYYWIRLVSVNGTLGDEIGPASAMARPLIADLIAMLTGYIDSGVLATALRAEIDSITLNYNELLQEIQDRISNDAALSAALAEMNMGLTEAMSFINSEITSRVNGDSALIEQIDTVAALNENTAAALMVEVSARVDGDEAQAEMITQLFTANETTTAAILDLSSAYIDANEALASQISTVETTLSGNISSVEVALTSNIDFLGNTVTEIGALYTAKVGVNGLIGGFGIYNDGTEVQAGFDVDLFWIGRTNTDGRKPFIILDDQVYIDEAAINSLTFNKLRDEAGTFVVEGGKIKTNYIETRGLEIRDYAGNIILSSGTALDWGYIGGAYKAENNATYGASFDSNIYGQIHSGNISTYIANLAVGRAQIANLAIGSAQIGNAAIGNAHIGNAAVGTLSIAGNAVIIPVFASSAGFYTTATLVLDQAATVVAHGVCSGMYMKNGGLTARLYYKETSSSTWIEFHNSFSNSEGGVNPTLSIPVMASIALPAGSWHINVSIDATAGTNQKCSLVVMGVKR
jgi:hypothetical protein